MVSNFALAIFALLAFGWSPGHAEAALLSGAGAPLKSMVDDVSDMVEEGLDSGKFNSF